MKKTSLANLIIIIGLLILGVMTLIAVYATAPESSVLLLDETFSNLDESKWRHEISECKEDGELFYYDTEDGKTSELITDGILHLRPNLTNVEFRSKSETLENCTLCNDYKDTQVVRKRHTRAECESLFSAKVETTNVLDANKGRIKLRAKLRSENSMKFCIEVKPKSEEVLEEFSNLENETNKNNFSEFRIFFKSAPNEAVINSEITDHEFHIYEINWDCEKISLKIDNKEAEEKRFEVTELAEESNSNKTVKFNSVPISQPFYLKMGVEFAEKQSENKSSFNKSRREINEKNVFEVDYIQLFKILN